MNAALKSLLRRYLPRRVTSHRILSGSLRGQRIFTSWHDYPAAILGYTERPLLAWFARCVQAGETWLDVGAYYGYTAVALSRLVGESGRVFAFEPTVRTAGYLSETRQINVLPQLSVLPLALGAAESLEVKRLPVTRGMVDSGIDRGEWEETLLVASLDWLWPRICGERKRIHGVKVDVQGMEIDVLRGMADMLREHKPKLVVEVHRGVSRPGLLSLIESLGYGRHPEPIEPVEGEVGAQYIDDRSYAFEPVSERRA